MACRDKVRITIKIQTTTDETFVEQIFEIQSKLKIIKMFIK